MSERIEKIKEVPTQEYTGKLLAKPIDYTPTEFYESIGLDKEEYLTFVLRPLKRSERHVIAAEKSKAMLEAIKWARENGIDVTKLNIDKEETVTEDERKESAISFVAVSERIETAIDKSKIDDLIRKCIVDIKGKNFPKESDGTLSKDIFENFPDELILLLERKVNEISYLSTSEKLGL